MEPGKRPGEALRRLIAILERQVDQSLLVGDDVQRCQIKPSVPDILCAGIPGHDLEALLQIELREVHRPGHLFRPLQSQQIRLHVVYGFPYALQPVHLSSSRELSLFPVL